MDCKYCGNRIEFPEFVGVTFNVPAEMPNKRGYNLFCDWECAAEFAAEVVGGELTIG